jgi:hypothetical protein
VALVAFALYVAWSYLSISWAVSPGDALAGSNRALLYLLVFATMLVLPWTARTALLAFVVFAVGVGVIAVVLLVRLASADHVEALIDGGRLAAPTGYFNATAALFTIEALTAIALAARRELPGLLRGGLLAFACAGLQLALIVQSRAWLFTLPLIALAAIVLLPDRLRVTAAAVLPVGATLVTLHRLLHVYQASSGRALDHAAAHAGHAALLACGAAFVLGTLLAWTDSLIPEREPSLVRRRVIGSIVVVLAILFAGVGGVAATHGHPFRFISRQWNGFSHTQTAYSGSHFADVGSGRYDFWRVSLDAFRAHPVGGLGQDNFAEYYVRHRRTGEEPAWTHSLELRLLVHTGVIGFLLFAVFLVAAVMAALRTRRRGGLSAAVAGIAALPFVVWLIHGSVDWFWEIPALTAPALGFLAVGSALGAPGEVAARRPAQSRGVTPAMRAAAAGTAIGALLAGVVVIGFPYLAVREVSTASDVAARSPAQALRDLSTAADLNPLSSDPARLAGTIALSTNQFPTARARFEQAIARDPCGWYAWLGAGLAASAQGDRELARHDFAVAASINPRQPVIQQALGRVNSSRPVSPADALQQLAKSLE